MKDRSYFLRPDIATYEKKFLLLCNLCKVDNIKLGVQEQKPHVKRIKIEENETR